MNYSLAEEFNMLLFTLGSDEVACTIDKDTSARTVVGNLLEHCQNMLVVDVAMRQFKYPDSARQVAYQNRVLERVRQLPGVVAAATAQPLAELTTDAFLAVAARVGETRLIDNVLLKI